MNNNNYLQKVWDGELEELRQATGGRNNALFRVATRLYQFVEGGSFPEEEVTTKLFNEAVSLKLPANEVRSTLNSARRKVLGNPALVPAKNNTQQQVQLIAPEPAIAPNEIWQQTAKAFLDWSFKKLWYGGAMNAIRYLNKRQISGITAMRHYIGYNPSVIYRPREKWGLGTDTSDTIVIPEGIVIPYFVDKQIWKIEIRATEGGNKHTIAGSVNSMWGYDTINPTKPIMLTEGVINGMTIAEYSRQMIQPVALGAVTHGRKIKFMSKLASAPVVLISTDCDSAGESGAQWWLNVLSHNAVRWKPLMGDVNDMAMNGQDISSWIEAGLDYAYDTVFSNEKNI